MKVVGRRFWIWMSVWALSFFVKGDLLSSPQEKPAGQVTEGTSNSKHNVPTLKTASGKVFPKGQRVVDKTSLLYKSGLKTGKVTPNLSSGGDRPTESYKTTSGLKTTSKSGGQENPTESFKTASKTHAHKTPKHPK
jgi:hypothetical protein